MTSRITDLESLRKELRAMSRGDLLIIAERAIELVPRATLQALVGDYVHVEDGASEARATPNALLDEVQTFHVDSLAGRYFEDFAVNSRNCTEQSRGTDAFIAEFKRLLRDASVPRTADNTKSPARRSSFFSGCFGISTRDTTT
jgi:hypothetical protein